MQFAEAGTALPYERSRWCPWTYECSLLRQTLRYHTNGRDGVRGLMNAVCWGRHCATIRKVAMVSVDFYIDIILPVAWTKMSTRNISRGGKGSRCVGLKTLPPSRADWFEIWEPQPPGALRTCKRPGQGLIYRNKWMLYKQIIAVYCVSHKAHKHNRQAKCSVVLMLKQGVLCIARLIVLLEFMDFFGRTPDYNSYWTLTFKRQT